MDKHSDRFNTTASQFVCLQERVVSESEDDSICIAVKKKVGEMPRKTLVMTMLELATNNRYIYDHYREATPNISAISKRSLNRSSVCVLFPWSLPHIDKKYCQMVVTDSFDAQSAVSVLQSKSPRPLLCRKEHRQFRPTHSCPLFGITTPM